jgi:hypothetical protein
MDGQDNGGSKADPGSTGSVNVVKTVLFAFLGIRKRAEHEVQTVRLSPAQIIVTGVVAAAVFVVSLVLLAKFIVGKAMG